MATTCSHTHAFSLGFIKRELISALVCLNTLSTELKAKEKPGLLISEILQTVKLNRLLQSPVELFHVVFTQNLIHS